MSKICGITIDDVHTVVNAGADAMGLNFAEQSSRRVSLGTACDLADAVAGRLIRVGLFVDAQAAYVTPANVAEAIARTQPYGVDVSGGVESGHKGEKDPKKVMTLVSEVCSVGIQ